MKKTYKTKPFGETIDKHKVYDIVANHLYREQDKGLGRDSSIDIGYQTIYRRGESTWQTYCENKQKYIFGDIDTMLDVCGEDNIALFADREGLVRVGWIAADA